MLTASEIKNVTFSKSMNGFKRDEVEIFLDKVESDYAQYERIISDYQAKVKALEEEISNFKNSQDSIKNVLLNAQKLADSMIKEAKEKSEEIVLMAEANINTITEQEKELALVFEQKANERKEALQKELDLMTKKAEAKAKSITAASEDAVKRQQVLFDKLKLEVAAFKSSVTAKYKEHLTLLHDIPDTVDMDPQKLTEILSAKIDAMPDIDAFLPVATVKEETKEILEPEDTQFVGFKVEEV